MNNNYLARFDSVTEEIQSTSILSYARMENSQNTFTRKRKMPVNDLIISILGRKGQTTAMEVKNFFQKKM